MNTNPFEEKLNVGHAIYEIGKGCKINLYFDKRGGFMIEGRKEQYFPEEQGPLKRWDYHTEHTVPKDAEGDWAKYAAEDMLSEIEKQMKKNAI
tara:strand:- start:1174 stop:1452 length:279 start_codon:yes stop_codon:yes gene_type:complete